VVSDRATSSGDFSSANVEACLGNLDWMLTPVLLLWPISLALTWLVAQNIAGKAI
jgi:hypothetical protein